MGAMGAWGPAIFADDTACDVRDGYRALLAEQVPDDEATRRVIDRFDRVDPVEAHVPWLALAAAQHQVGRLDDDVKQRALAVIDSGDGLKLWAQAGPRELEKRKAALATLRDQLTGPQPPRKTVPRPWRHATDLEPGMVLAHTSASGPPALFRVIRVDATRHAASPVLERLDWHGRKVPSKWQLRRLKPRPMRQDVLPGHTSPAERYLVSRFHQTDPDWADVGFAVVGSTPVSTSGDAVEVLGFTQWRGLATSLGGPGPTP